MKKRFGSAVTGETAIKPRYAGNGLLVLEPTYKYILFEAKMGDPPYSDGANGIFSKSYWYVITSIGYNQWKVQCINTIPVNVRLAFYNVPLYVKKPRGTGTDIPEEIEKRETAYTSYFKDTDSNVLYVSNGDDDTRTKILLPIVSKSGFTIKNSHFQNWEKGNKELITFVKGIQHRYRRQALANGSIFRLFLEASYIELEIQ